MFTMSDWAKVCDAFNLTLTEVMSVLGSKAPVRREVRRAGAARPSVTTVSDSDSVASSVASSVAKDNFANSKARAFAAEHGFAAEDVTGTGKNGKIKLGDLKKLLPPKKRGRKAKQAPAVSLDVVDSLAAESPKAQKAPEAPKGKRVKDPNHPKHPSTSWIFFLNAHRDKLRKENPAAKMTEITKMASALWKATATDARAPYAAQAVADKARYAHEMSTYVAPDPVYLLPKKKRTKPAVKKATNPWMAYLNAHRDILRKEHPDAKMTEITKLASVAYKALSDPDRVPWVAIAEADKTRYAKELAAHAAKQSPAAATTAPAAPAAKKASPAKKAPSQSAVVFDTAAAVEFEIGADDEFDIEGADSDNDELDEDEPVEFEWQGTTYWRSWDGLVMDDPAGATIGRWDDESSSIVFDD